MRTTLHLVSAADYLAYAGIYRERRIAELQRQLAALGEEADFADDGERLARFAAERPRSRPELLALARQAQAPHRGPSRPGSSGTGSRRTPGSSTGPSSSVWREHTAGGTFVPARTWLGADGVVGRRRRRTPRPPLPGGVRPRDPAGHRAVDGSSAERHRPRTRAARGSGASETSSIASSTTSREPRFLPPRHPRPARLLPRFDNLVLSHDDRRRVLPTSTAPP